MHYQITIMGEDGIPIRLKRPIEASDASDAFAKAKVQYKQELRSQRLCGGGELFMKIQEMVDYPDTTTHDFKTGEELQQEVRETDTSLPEQVAANLRRLTGDNSIQAVKWEENNAVNGKIYKPFDRIRVKSLVRRQHRGQIIIDRGGEADLVVMPVPEGKPARLSLTSVGTGGSHIGCQPDPIEGKHFQFI